MKKLNYYYGTPPLSGTGRACEVSRREVEDLCVYLLPLWAGWRV